MVDCAVYGGLLVAALLAAPIPPGRPEAVLVGTLRAEDRPAAALVAVTGLDDILGTAALAGS